MSIPSRRDFLKASSLLVMAGAAGYLNTDQFVFAADEPGMRVGDAASSRQKATIVTVFLRGGADALNAFVPVGDDAYYRARPRIALHADAATKGRFKGEKGVVSVGKETYWALNAGLAPLVPLIEKGTVAPIMNVGSTNGTRSHFSAQDYMERGVPGDDGITSGWLNRYLELTKQPFDRPLRGLSAQTLVPRALRGPYPVLAGNNATEQMDLFETLYSSKNMVNMNAREDATAQKGARLDDMTAAAPHALTSDETREVIAQSGANAIERIKALEKADRTPNSAEYPAGGLGSQLATIARVIKANVGLEAAQVDYGGWDHHSGQGGAGGKHSQMLRHLSDALVAFHEDLGSRMDRVLVLVMTEFGRTVNDNGASGTDHGRGGFMIAMGNMIKPPASRASLIRGTWNGMNDLDSGRFLPVHTDFRGVFAESIYKLFNVDPIKAKIFPDFNNRASVLDILNPLPVV